MSSVAAAEVRPGQTETGQVIIDPRFKHGVATREVLFSDLDTYERMAIVAITYHGEVAFPSLTRLAQLMGCSRSTAHGALKRLQRKGWLEVTARWETDGGRTSNRYHLRYPPSGSRTGESGSRTGPVREPDPIPDQNLRLEKEEENGAAKTPAPFLPPSRPQESETPPEGGEGRAQRGAGTAPASVPASPCAAAEDTAAADRMRELFAGLCQERLGRVPAVVVGRDRHMMTLLVRQYGEPDVDRIIRAFVAYRVRESRVVTMQALVGAAEAVFQRLPAKRPPGPVQEHPVVRREREWAAYMAAQRAAQGRGS